MTKQLAPFGSWESPITSDMVAGKSPKIAETRIHQGHIFWLESKPEEKGRNAIMMYRNGQSQCLLPAPLSAKSKVHEYGGGSYLVHGSLIYFVLADDQQIYVFDFQAASFDPVQLTFNENQRFADLAIAPETGQLFAVCEDHSQNDQEPQNTIVSIDISTAGDSPLKASGVAGTNSVSVVCSGHDFYSNPRVSPNGEKICWVSWDHPNMPWDNSELWQATLAQDGTLSQPQKISGNGNESIFQPQWSPNGTLFFVSDRNNWWNIYQYQNDTITSVTELSAEFATPQWTFNMSTYSFLNNNAIFATYSQDGAWHICEIDVDNRALKPLGSPCTMVYSVACENDKAVFIGSTPTSLTNVYLSNHSCSHFDTLLTPPFIPKEDISIAQAIHFPTTHNQQTYGFYYPPANSSFTCEGAPPVIVICHGGPTGATANSLELKIQYWTSRGFAVMDVNYRGSTGYGRQFRHLLHKKWGILDVDDVSAAAKYAVDHNLAAQNQCIIKGSSAGGYTVLAALAFTDTFDCGVSLYGIGDLETLARDTHKFEARYLDSLVGAYPEEQSTYIERSPIHKVEDIRCPLLVFQGLEDKVVPPNQAEAMVSAVRNNNMPVSYVKFDNEGHGFRQAENIKTMLEEELAFYTKIFNLDCSPDKHG